MSQETIQELRGWLAGNPLEDADDLMEYVQYASRLAALGDSAAFANVPELFARAAFDGRVTEILGERCAQGIWEIMEYDGEELALSLMDAQDFYIFEKMAGEAPWLTQALKWDFADWWHFARHVDLDADAALMLEDFLESYPIPEALCLSVVRYPITVGEYALLDEIYADVELPVFTIDCYPLRQRMSKEPESRSKDMSRLPSPVEMVAFADGRPSDMKRFVETRDNCLETPLGPVLVSRHLDDDWMLWVFVRDVEKKSPPVVDIRIDGMPGIRSESDPSVWNFRLGAFDGPTRARLLVEPLEIRFTPGFIGKCVFLFAGKDNK